MRLPATLSILLFLHVLCVSPALAGGQDDGCVRDLPQPVVNATARGVAAHSFNNLPGREAVEDVTLRDGLEIRVSHYGCAHYGLAFEFKVRARRPVNGLGLLREADALVGRLIKADPKSHHVGDLRAAIRRGLKRRSYRSGRFIPVGDEISWVAVSDEVDGKGRRRVRVVYDVAL